MALLEAPSEMLFLEPTSLDERLSKGDHHLRVVRVGAPAAPGSHHLDFEWNLGMRDALERHSQRVTYERAKQSTLWPL